MIILGALIAVAAGGVIVLAVTPWRRWRCTWPGCPAHIEAYTRRACNELRDQHMRDFHGVAALGPKPSVNGHGRAA